MRRLVCQVMGGGARVALTTDQISSGADNSGGRRNDMPETEKLSWDVRSLEEPSGQTRTDRWKPRRCAAYRRCRLQDWLMK